MEMELGRMRKNCRLGLRLSFGDGEIYSVVFVGSGIQVENGEWVLKTSVCD